MAFINLQDVNIDFPVFNSTGRSLKKRLIHLATGGQLNEDASGVVVVRALENLSFTIQDGERVALLGHNGAGKSTLLRVLSSVYAPTHGTAYIQGKLGSLIDISLGIDLEATGRDNIFLRGCLLGMSKSNIQATIDEIIDFTELGDFIDMPLRTYSTGMSMRLAFAVSTAVQPEILLMDEWLSVGDENFKDKAEKRLKKLLSKTNLLVMATHSYEIITSICNKAIWLEHGRLKEVGDAKTVADMYFGR